MSQVRTILDQLSSVLVATGNGLQPCTYRGPLESGPRDGTHRRFEMLVTRTGMSRQLFGAGYAAVDLDLRVRVYYSRLGGDAGAGDRKSTNATAGDDGMRIADSLTLSPNWSQNTTGIREVTMLAGGGWSRVIDGKDFEVYELRLRCEASVEPWPLPVAHL